MKPSIRLRSFLAATGSTLLAIPAVPAQSTWVPTAAGTTYNWQTAGNWSPSGAPSGSTVTANLNNNIAGAQTISLNGAVTLGALAIGDSDNTHAFTLQNGTGGSLTFNNGGSGASLTETGSTADTVSATITLSDNLAISTAGALTLSGNIGGTGAITKSGAGALTLSGTNNYSGGFTLSAGRVDGITGSYGGFGSGSLTINGGNMHFSGSSTINNDMIWNTGVNNFQFSRPGTGTPIVTFNGDAEMTGNFTTSQSGTQPVSGVIFNGNISATGATKTLTLGTAATTHTVNGAITGSIALTKTGTATLNMTGANNFSGLLTLSDGTVNMTTPSTIGGLNVASGKTFVYAPRTAGSLNINGAYTLASAVTLNAALGGTASQSSIAATGAASLAGTGVVNIRTVSGSSPAAGTHNLVNAASGLNGGIYTLNRVFNNTDYTVSNFTRSATAISVDVASASAINGTVFWKGGLSGTTGVWSATNGSTQSNWQVTDGVNQGLAPGATADLVFSTATSPGTMAGMTLGSDMTVRTITINNTASAFSLNADGLERNNILTITPSSSSSGITIGTGVQTLSIAAPVRLGADQKWTNNSSNLFTVSGTVDTNGNDLEVAGRTTISGAIFGSGGVTKSGSGTFILGTNSNSYTGPTRVLGGVLQIGADWNNNGAIPGGVQGNPTTGSNLEINGGIVALTWDMARLLGNGPGRVQITGGRSGFAMLTDPRNTVTIGGSTSFELVWGASGEGAATGFFNPSTLVLNDSAAGGTEHLILQNLIDLNGATRTIETANSNAASYGQISGVIRNSSITSEAGLIKSGAGELRLNSANTYNGTTRISDGILNLTNSSALQNSALDTSNSVAGTASVGLRTNQTTLTLGGLIGDKNFAASGGVFTTTTGGYGSVTALTLNPGAGQSRSYSGVIENGAAGMTLTKSGAGTQALTGTNTYTGATSITAGVLEASVLANGGTNSSIGASSNANTNLSLSNGATFRYIGSSDVTTDRGFRINGTAAGHGASIESSGTGTLSFNNTVAINWGTTNQTRTLTLGGTNMGANTMGKVIANNGTGATSLVKIGTGTWVLDQANTYSGSTTINGGVLNVSAGNINGTSGVTINAGGELRYDSADAGLTRPVHVNGGTFRYNASTAYSGTLNYTSGTLSGTNLTGSAFNGQVIGTGKSISPGNSPGTMSVGDQTWTSGGTYLWEINNATGTAGNANGWDLLSGSGTLDITASLGSEFIIDLTTLASVAPDVLGNAINFDGTNSYTWLIADFAAVTGFSTDAFTIDASGFSNSPLSGSFGISLGGVGVVPGDNTQVYLTYTYIPEPGAALLGGIGTLLLLRRRRS